jgi:hypothetical protein
MCGYTKMVPKAVMTEYAATAYLLDIARSEAHVNP